MRVTRVTTDGEGQSRFGEIGIETGDGENPLDVSAEL